MYRRLRLRDEVLGSHHEFAVKEKTMLLSLARKMEKIFRENREMRETIRKLEGTHLDVKEKQ